jgi:hypothetical protein
MKNRINTLPKTRTRGPRLRRIEQPHNTDRRPRVSVIGDRATPERIEHDLRLFEQENGE